MKKTLVLIFTLLLNLLISGFGRADSTIGGLPDSTGVLNLSFMVPVSNGTPPTYRATLAQILGLYNFNASLTQSGGQVSLVGDSATPGNSMYYGTNSSGVKGFYSLSAAGGSLNGPGSITVGNVPSWASSSLLGNGYGVGTGPNDLVQLNSSGQLPAISGALLTNLPPGPQGATGATGPAGPQGAIGPQGPAGNNGSAVGTLLLSGGSIVWTSGYSYNVAAATYQINGTQYSSAAGTVTLAPANSTYDRIDAIALNKSGGIVSITGIADGNVLQPVVDPTLYCQLTFVYVLAGSTSPSSSTNWIYENGTEWTTTASAGTITFGTTNPLAPGTHDIYGNAVAANTYFTSVSPSPITSANQWDNMIFYLDIPTTAWVAGKNITLQWYNGTNTVGSIVTIVSGNFGFNRSATGTYQQISVPISMFGITVGQTIDRVRVTFTGTGTNVVFYIADIQIQQGVSSQSQYPVTYRGAWSGTTAYNIDDVAVYAGQVYICEAPNTNQVPSPSSIYWGILGSTIPGGAYDIIYSSTVAINWSNGATQKIILTGNVTSLSFSGWQPGGSYFLKIVQGGSGSYTMAFPASSYPTWQWQGGVPTLSTAPNTADWITFKVDADGYISAGPNLLFQ